MTQSNQVGIIALLLIACGMGLGFTMSMKAHRTGVSAFHTDNLNPGYVGCTTQTDLTTYDAAPHKMQVFMIIDGKCIATEDIPDHLYVILDTDQIAHPDQTVHVRLLLDDDQFADIYVPREATMVSYTPERNDGR